MTTKVALILSLFFASPKAAKFPVRMPLVTPTVDEVYLCTQVYIGHDTPYWLTGFTPISTPGKVHHMVLAGCNTNPMQAEHKAWNCGHSEHPVMEPGLVHSTTCVDGGTGSRSLYVWSDRGEELHLPPDMGYPVGKDTMFQYLVLQVQFYIKALITYTSWPSRCTM